jgi:hypothetical protein
MWKTQDHFLNAVKEEEGLTSRSCSEVFGLGQIQQECFLEKNRMAPNDSTR